MTEALNTSILDVLSAAHPTYRPRPAQARMAAEIAVAIEQGETLLIDAPTGIGKSLASLVPVAQRLLQNGGRAAYATATIALQEQLVRKDIPIIQTALGGPEAVLVKGMGRYLCKLKWEAGQDELDLGTGQSEFDAWAQSTSTGDQGELEPVPDFWHDVAADSDDCLGRKCTYHSSCFALNARERAWRVPLAAINHHLLLLRVVNERWEEWPGIVVVDEAHKFAGSAAAVFGTQLSSRALDRLMKKAHGLVREGKNDLHGDLYRAAGVHDKFMGSFQITAGETAPITPSAVLVAEYIGALDKVTRALASLPRDLEGEIHGISFEQRRDNILKMWQSYVKKTSDVFAIGEIPGKAKWVERERGRLMFKVTPVEPSEHLQPFFEQSGAARILMSATLATGRDFSLVKQQLGVPNARTLILPHIFDYWSQMRYYMPLLLPDPTDPDYVKKVSPIVHGLLLASQGRALVLFTSYRDLKAVSGQVEEMGLPFTIMTQDASSGTRLVDRFKADVSSVLFATSRYWEGIDLPGETLSLVVVMKIPFSVPTHPLEKAKQAAVVARGGHPFMDLSVPEAIVRLRQGVGRLIRSHDDRGVVALLDPRLQTKVYGRTIMRALPEAPRVQRLDDVRAFLEVR